MKNLSKELKLLEYIKTYSTHYGYPPTVREMCKAIKVSSTSTVAYYLTKLENEGYIKRSPNKNRALEILSNSISDTSINLYNMRNEKLIPIPVLGTITAGMPILAVENCEEYFMVSPNMFRGENLFMLNVVGNSMVNVGILSGDQVVIKKQEYANNGEIVAAMIDGMATVKRFYKEDNRYKLQPENDEMPPIFTDKVDILGKVVGLVRKF